MSVEQGTRLRNGKIIDSAAEISLTNPSVMAEANSVDTDSNKNNDVSCQLAEIKENFERKISDLRSEFSQLRDLMMTVLKKSDNDSQNANTQGPSKQPKVWLDMHFIGSLIKSH